MEGQVPVLLLGVWTQQVSDGKRELGLQFSLQVVLGSRAGFVSGIFLSTNNRDWPTMA